MSDRRYVADMPIKSICGRKNLYGEDLTIENWFRDLEGKWADLLRKIISQETIDLSDEELAYMYMLVFLSDARTGYMADSITDITTKTIQTMALLGREHGEFDFTDEEIKNLRANIDKPNLPHLQSMATSIDVMSDLVPVLIVNTTSKSFITSDSPMVKYNYLFIKRNYKKSSGLGHVGAQIFLPLSPKLCFLLYDSVVYDIKTDNQVLKINAPDQIIRLNSLFAQNAKSIVLFKNDEKEWLINKYTYGVKDTSNFFNNSIFKGESGYMIMVSSPSLEYDARLSFCSIKDPFLTIDFPSNAAGPLRPIARMIADKHKEEDKTPQSANGIYWPYKL